MPPSLEGEHCQAKNSLSPSKVGKTINTFCVIFMTLPESPRDKLMLFFFVSEGDAESFLVCAVNSTIPVGLPFDIPLHMKDGYGHPAIPPNNLKPSLRCRWVTTLYKAHIVCFVDIPSKIFPYHCCYLVVWAYISRRWTAAGPCWPSEVLKQKEKSWIPLSQRLEDKNKICNSVIIFEFYILYILWMSVQPGRGFCFYLGFFFLCLCNRLSVGTADVVILVDVKYMLTVLIMCIDRNDL